jgi:hypothetical protein
MGMYVHCLDSPPGDGNLSPLAHRRLRGGGSLFGESTSREQHAGRGAANGGQEVSTIRSHVILLSEFCVDSM